MSIQAEKINLIVKMILSIRKALNNILSQIPVIVHHSATDRDTTTFEAIDRGHQNRGYPKSSLGYYCGYDYFIESDGKVTQARRELEPDFHTSAYQGLSIGICLAGNFTFQQPSEEQLKSLKELLETMKLRYNGKVSVHKDYYNTECCGKNLIKFVREYKRS